jgi:Tfp pilus assembly protein PilV
VGQLFQQFISPEGKPLKRLVSFSGLAHRAEAAVLMRRRSTGTQALRAAAAFSLIELLVAVALMSFIVLGLLAMFTQTQRAFRASVNQTDVLESGRVATDMMTRELGQMTASGRAFTTNLSVELWQAPLLQGLPGTTYNGNPSTEDQRTNLLQRVFFLTQNNQNWTGIGYIVVPDSTNGGVGTLYRFSTNHNNYGATNIFAEFIRTPLVGMSRVADGVVHFRLRAFGTNGYPITQGVFGTNSYAAVFRRDAFGNVLGPLVRNTLARDPLVGVPDIVNYAFWSNALPAYVELELGVLEPNVVDHFKAIGNPTAQLNYLSNHVAQVHVFRQRVPIRTVDYSVYQ